MTPGLFYTGLSHICSTFKTAEPKEVLRLAWSYNRELEDKKFRSICFEHCKNHPKVRDFTTNFCALTCAYDEYKALKAFADELKRFVDTLPSTDIEIEKGEVKWKKESTLCKEDLDDVQNRYECTDPKCELDHKTLPLPIEPVCHPGWPVHLLYDNGDAQVICAACRQPVVSVSIKARD